MADGKKQDLQGSLSQIALSLYLDEARTMNKIFENTNINFVSDRRSYRKHKVKYSAGGVKREYWLSFQMPPCRMQSRPLITLCSR